MINFANGLKQVGDQLLIEFTRSLVDQGHKATGTLISSFETRITIGENESFLEISFEEYGIFLDTGRKKGTKRVPIDALISWIVTKGIASNSKEVRSIAFAIQTNIFKQGIPTSKGKGFSSTGKRTGWFTDTLLEKQAGIEEFLEILAGKEIEVTFNTEVDKVTNDFSKNPILIPL